MILQCITLTGFATENEFTFSDNDPSWFVYQRFNGYHARYAEFEPLFLQEINDQGLCDQIVGEPFNVYFSETDWAIGCRLKKKIAPVFPMEILYCKSEKLVKIPYQGPDQNISFFLEAAYTSIQDKGYYWDGCLIVNLLSGNTDIPVYELVVPVSRDYYKLFIKPYGVARVVITFLCLLFAVFLLSLKKGNVLSNRILGAFMVNYILINLNAFIWIYNLYREWPHFYNFGISFQFLTGPLLLFYTLSVVTEKFSFRKFHLLHLLPFMIVAAVYFFLFQINDAESKLRMLNNGFRQSPFFDWIYTTGMIQKMAYLMVSVYIVFRHSRRMHYMQFKTEKHLLFTLKFLLIGILSLLVVEIIKNEIHVQAKLHYIIKAFGILIYLAMVSTLIIRGLLFPEMFSGNGRNGNGQKYHKSPLTPEHKTYYLRKIISYMDEAEPYLSSSVNLTDFARAISVPSRYLSQVLNEELGMSFYDLMNKYRIDKAGKLLADPGYNESIIDIAWECGFNSKSVFNAAFKKYTGMTPSDFRIERQHAIQ